MSAYYNEHDPFAAAWLRELIKAGHIAPGEVDERSIEDVRPDELRGFTQCHFFAGIGVWSYALRQAGWPDDRPVWTGSCPCQPFSAAGKRAGVADERHLWPSLFHLVGQCHPPTLFGEQVASKDGLSWIDTVLADLESQDYASWAWDLCSAGFGAPHIRQRLYFVADATRERLDRGGNFGPSGRGQHSDGGLLEHTPSEQVGIPGQSRQRRETGSLVADPNESVPRKERQQRGGKFVQPREDERTRGGLANNNNTGLPERISIGRVQREALEPSTGQASECRGLVNGFWANAEWIPCRDEKFRPIESGSSPLATGITNRVGKLRGYGNALTAPVAQGFIEAFLETETECHSKK